MTTAAQPTTTPKLQLPPSCSSELYRLFRRRGESHADAEDLAQETVLRLLDLAHRDGPSAPNRTYVRRCGHYLHCEWVTKKVRRPLVFHEELVEATPAPEAAETTPHWALEWLTRLCPRLKPEQRELLVARAILGMSYRELSHEYGADPSTLHHRIRHAQGAVRRRTARRVGAPPIPPRAGARGHGTSPGGARAATLEPPATAPAEALLCCPA